jgi:TRAP-type uncharacterized transport system substrate-binding protein
MAGLRPFVFAALCLFGVAAAFAAERPGGTQPSPLRQAAPPTPQAKTPPSPPAFIAEDKEKANQNTVSIVGSGTASIYTRLAEDIFQVLDDPNNNEIRILPIIGRGGAHNMFDLLNLKGIDMGMTDDTMLDHYKVLDPKKYGNIDQRIHYIAKLANAEMHVVARKEIKDMRDLRGKKVGFYQKGSVTAIVAKDLFEMLDIPVEPMFLHQEEADKALKAGEISAALRIVSAPMPFIQKFKKDDNLHLLPIDSALPGFDKIRYKYLPAQIKHEHYPGLIPEGENISTIANAIMLAVYAWPENTERYRKIANFVNRFFNNIDKFMLDPRHPKWREINLAAEVPGWKRFKPAQAWLNANKSRLSTMGNIRPAFETFARDHAQANGQKTMSPQQSEALTSEFMQWWDQKKSANPR